MDVNLFNNTNVAFVRVGADLLLNFRKPFFFTSKTKLAVTWLFSKQNENKVLKIKYLIIQYVFSIFFEVIGTNIENIS